MSLRTAAVASLCTLAGAQFNTPTNLTLGFGVDGNCSKPGLVASALNWTTSAVSPSPACFNLDDLFRANTARSGSLRQEINGSTFDFTWDTLVSADFDPRFYYDTFWHAESESGEGFDPLAKTPEAAAERRVQVFSDPDCDEKYDYFQVSCQSLASADCKALRPGIKSFRVVQHEPEGGEGEEMGERACQNMRRVRGEWSEAQDSGVASRRGGGVALVTASVLVVVAWAL